jgi:hypothetical protein
MDLLRHTLREAYLFVIASLFISRGEMISNKSGAGLGGLA